MNKPTAVVQMDNGQTIILEMNPEAAPNTVRNFIKLAGEGFYDGLLFHRVIPGFMIQGGCPDGTGMGGPGYHIRGEFASNGWNNPIKHTRGVISMARAAHHDSAGSQFFVKVADAPHLDGQYAAFGQVTSGMQTVDAIVAVERNLEDRPLVDQRIARITVDTHGEALAGTKQA